MSLTPTAVPVRDPRALRALAHPARLAILEQLSSRGTATATECAAAAGASPSACSYHLRALQRWGLVEEVDGTDRRERRWRALGPFVFGDHDGVRGADVAAAEHLLAAEVLDRARDRALAWLDASDREEPAWRDVTAISSRRLVMTPAELTDTLARIDDLLAPFVSRGRAEHAPTGTRQVHLHLAAVPDVP